MKFSNKQNSKKRRYNHVFNDSKNIKAEILNITVLELTECDNRLELKSLNMTLKNRFTLVSFFVCMNAILMVQKSSMKAKTSHNFGYWKTRFAKKGPLCRKCFLNSRNRCSVLNVSFKMLMFFHDSTVESAEKQTLNKDPTAQFPSSKNLAQNSSLKACFAPV